MSRRKGFRLGLLAAGAVLAVLVMVAPARESRASQQGSRPGAGRVHVRPVYWRPQQARPAGDSFSCQASSISGADGPRCYSPQQIQQAYGYSGLLASGVNGAGETIVIVDGYSNPYIATDLSMQDSTFGLPSTTLAVVPMPGLPAFDIYDPNQVGWASEITLDVLAAHAMAPAAKITLVEAASDSDPDILAATKYAVDNNLGSVISESFGEAEACVDPGLLGQEHALFTEAVSKGMTLFASSGDSGASQYNCDGTGAILAVGSPASDPLVTGVGGTTLNASDPTGTYLGETAWTEGTNGITCNPPDETDISCSGGGFSSLYQRPSWQGGADTRRGVPDVSFDAGTNGGVLVECAVCNVASGYPASDPTPWIFGGTSAGSPQWAALAADAAQMAGHPLGNINPVLYQIAAQPASYAAAFHDVTIGSNRVAVLGDGGYYAGSGWDPVTGLGTPNAAGLLPILQGPPTNTALPVVSGVAAAGKVLTTTQGEWQGSPTSYAYQWQRCAPDGSGCVSIAGATTSTYTPSAPDAGHVLEAQVSATNAGGTAAAASAHTAVVIGVPVAKKKPHVAGRPKVGRTLKAKNGIWTGPPSRYRYEWLRCSRHGRFCRRIRNARYAAYRVRGADVGHRLRVKVTARNIAGKAATVSGPSRVVGR